MTTLMILVAGGIWAAGLVLVIALCRSAAYGDQWSDDHSLERAAQQYDRQRRPAGRDRLRHRELV